MGGINAYIGLPTLPSFDAHQALINFHVAAGTARYVDPVLGSDSNTGTSAGAGHAWKTISKWRSLPNGASGGGLLICAGGEYTDADPSNGAPYAVILTGTSPNWTTSSPGILTNAHDETVTIRKCIRITWASAQIVGQSVNHLWINGWQGASDVGTETTLWVYGDDFYATNVRLSHFDPDNPTANTSPHNIVYIGDTGVPAQRPLFRKILADGCHYDGSGNQPHGFYVHECDGGVLEDFIITNIKSAVTDQQFAVQVGEANGCDFVIRDGLIYDCDGGVTTFTQSGGETVTTDVRRVVFKTIAQAGCVRTSPAGGGTTTVAVQDCHTDGETLIHSSNTGITNNGGNTTGAVTFGSPILPLSGTSFGPLSDWD